MTIRKRRKNHEEKTPCAAIVPGVRPHGSILPRTGNGTRDTPGTVAQTQTEQPQAQTFTHSAKGFGGDITVTITVTDGVLTDVAAQGSDETAGVGSQAVEQLPAAILEAGSPEVDGLSGPTLSSNALKQAARAAMEEAGLLTPSQAQVKMKPGAYTASANGFSLPPHHCGGDRR